PCFILAMNSGAVVGAVMPGSDPNGFAALALAFLIFLIPTGPNLTWLGPVTAGVQHLSSPTMRPTASALSLLLNNLLGIAVGIYWSRWMSHRPRPAVGEGSLRRAIYPGMGFSPLSSPLLFGASRTLQRDWVDE